MNNTSCRQSTVISSLKEKQSEIQTEIWPFDRKVEKSRKIKQLKMELWIMNGMIWCQLND
jgi:hypothetical protein